MKIHSSGLSPTPLRKALILFMRYPEPGKVKSRLAATVGIDEAARIYELLVFRTLGVAADFKRSAKGIDLFIALSPPERLPAARRRYPGPWIFFPQTGSHLGERMQRAIERVMRMGYREVVLVGSDIADIQESDFAEAFEALSGGYAVLGPAADGGFYLIGLGSSCPAAFDAPQWGTDEIFLRTRKALLVSGLQVRTLRMRKDIDRKEDIAHLSRILFLQTKLSVVIPMLSPPQPSCPLLETLEHQLWPGDEAIVVLPEDGPSTAAGPFSSGRTRFLTAPKGRGSQLNCGARAAVGEILLFLHADSSPPANAPYSVRKIIEAPGMSLGCFQLSFFPSTPMLGAIAGWANFRARHFKMPFGDQGLFCRRSVYELLGGFRNRFLMEDVDFVRRSREAGDLMILPDKILTSPRRYLDKGIFRASLTNQLLLLMYYLGVDERRLYSLYYDR